MPAQAERFKGHAEVVPLGDREAHHAESEHDGDADGQQEPRGFGQVRERQPEEEAHEQADEETRDGGHELVGGHVRDGAQDPACRHDGDVGSDGEADHAPGGDPGQEEGQALRAGLQQDRRGRVEAHEGDGEDDPQSAPDQAHEPQHGTGTLPEPRLTDRLASGTGGRLKGLIERLAEGAHGDQLEARRSGLSIRRVRGPPLGALSVARSAGTRARRKPSRAASRSRRSRPGTGADLAQQRDLAAGQHVRGDGRGRAPRRPRPAPAAGRGPARRR